MSHSTHVGFNCPPSSVLAAAVARSSLPERLRPAFSLIRVARAKSGPEALAFGVGQSPLTTTSVSDRPGWAFESGFVLEPADWASEAIGVGSRSLTASGSWPLPNRPEPVSFQSRALGLGQLPLRAIVERLGVPALGRSNSPPLPLIPFWLDPYSVAAGVGNKPDAIPLVRGAKGGSRKAVPLRVIPERGQLSENSAKPPSKEVCDVLHDDVSGSKLANQSGELEEKTRALPVEPGSLASAREVLAREASAKNVDSGEVVGSDLPDVGISRDIWPVSGEDSLAVGVDFDLPGDSHSGSLEAHSESSDAREKFADREFILHLQS